MRARATGRDCNTALVFLDLPCNSDAHRWLSVCQKRSNADGISRILYPDAYAPGDDHSSMRSTRNYPAKPSGTNRALFLFDLASGGVYLAACTLAPARWALTPPFHPYPAASSGAVYFLWHWPYRDVLSATSQVIPGNSLSCEVRTFLPAFKTKAQRPSPPTFERLYCSSG